MNSKQRAQIEWCVREQAALQARLEGCDLPNLAGKAAGVAGTLRDMLKQPVPRRRAKALAVAPGTRKTG